MTFHPDTESYLAGLHQRLYSDWRDWRYAMEHGLRGASSPVFASNICEYLAAGHLRRKTVHFDSLHNWPEGRRP